jgi:hypothetical protein
MEAGFMRKGKWLLLGSFIAFLNAGMLLMFFSDKDAVTQTENRTLAVLPQWSKKTLWSGDYFRGLENYAADHMAFRDVLVNISKAITSFQGLTGKDNAVLIASDANNSTDRSIKSVAEDQPLHSSLPSSHKIQGAIPPIIKEGPSQLSPNEAGHLLGKVLILKDRAMNLYNYSPIAGKTYADTINKFRLDASIRLNNPIRISVLLAPTSVEFIRSAKLKKLSSSQRDSIHAVYNQLDPTVAAIPALEYLQDHVEEDLFFRTDHHWTATGAYYAYAAFMNTQGIMPIPLLNYKTVDVKGFLGSLYSATLSKRLASEPDTIRLYKPYVKCEYYVHYRGPLKMDLLDMSHATKQNKYRIFLSGDRPWGQISTEINNGLRIAVIKDSFGNAFIPFLVPHYQEIFIIDPRQFDQELLPFIETHKINEVLFMNNIGVTSDSSFSELVKKISERT